jgi:hypothetical protein
MPDDDMTSFEDAALKAALQRALGGERASDALRSRVQQIFSDAPAAATQSFPISSPLRARPPIWRQPLWGLAAAAVILVCFGLATWRLESNRQIAQAMPALPDSFAEALVATHDHCAALPDHHVLKGVPDDDFRLMTQKLREQLGFPALAVTAGAGWKFYGASALCMVGPARSAHLVFKQNGDSLSIFSVAVASENWPDGKPPADGEIFANTQAGHPILSWVHNDTVYSVVGNSPDGSLNLQGIAPIADRLKVAISSSDQIDGDNGRTTVALQ